MIRQAIKKIRRIGIGGLCIPLAWVGTMFLILGMHATFAAHVDGNNQLTAGLICWVLGAMVAEI